MWSWASLVTTKYSFLSAYFIKVGVIVRPWPFRDSPISCSSIKFDESSLRTACSIDRAFIVTPTFVSVAAGNRNRQESVATLLNRELYEADLSSDPLGVIFAKYTSNTSRIS